MFEKLFGNLSDISNFMDTITTAANQKAVAAKQTAEVAVEEKGNISKSAAEYANEAQTTLQRLQKVEAAGAEARRMAESDNIFDRIALIGDQMINPREYTREGRQNQVAEMSTNLAVRGQIHNVEVNSSAAKIDLAIAQETAATAGVDAKMTMLRTQVDGLALANQAIAQTETLRQQNLIQVDLSTIQKTLMGPTPADGKIAIGGMQYTPAEIREREKALTTRTQLSMLTPQATDPDFAAKLRVHHDLQLGNYALPELELLRANNYIMADGTQVEPSLWDAHYNRQNQLQQDVLSRQLNQQALENQVPEMLKQSMQLSKSVSASATPGTPLAIANANFLAASNAVARVAASDVTPSGKMLQVTALAKAQEQLVKAVDQEALRKAAGDKELSQIYRSQMLGEPIQPSQVEDVLRSRYVANKGFGEVLPTDVATRVRKVADKKFAELQQKQAGQLDFGSVTKSAKELREEAVNQAIEAERNQAGEVGINLIQQGTGQRTDNPAIKNAGMVPGLIFDKQLRASNNAWADVGHAAGLSDEQLLMLKSGNYQEAGLTEEKASAIIEEANTMAVQYEYDMFEAVKPGLGYEMQQWYQTALPEMARNYSERLDPIQKVMVGDSVLVEAQKLADRYTYSDENATQRGRKLATEMATGAKKPENMWPVLLQMNGRLADSQKQAIFYDVIMPAVQAARQQGANDEVTTNAVFTALTNFKSDDPTLMAAIKTAQRELPDELDRFHTMWATMMVRGQPSKIRSQVVGKDPDLAAKQLQTILPWLTKE